MKKLIPLSIVTLTVLLLATITFSGSVNAAPVYDAKFVSSTVPATVNLGQTYTVSITMKDTHRPIVLPPKNAWPSTAKLVLSGYIFKTILYSAATKVPNAMLGTYSFPFTLKLTDGGTKTITGSMALADGTKFGSPFTITVKGVGDYAKVGSVTIPPSMNAGKSYTLSFTFKNTGTTTWTKPGYYMKYGSTSIPLPVSSVAPGTSCTFKVTIKVQTPGSKPVTAQMCHSGTVFGDVWSSNLIFF